MSTVNALTAINFRYVSTQRYTEAELARLRKEPGFFYDERLNIISEQTNLSSLEWYFNYLTTASDFARKSPGSYATQYLDLGYVPLVYVPACLPDFAVAFNNVLNSLEIPNIRVKATSFTRSYFLSDMYDTWVHKFDIAKVLNMEINQITSAEVARRLYAF